MHMETHGVDEECKQLRSTNIDIQYHLGLCSRDADEYLAMTDLLGLAFEKEESADVMLHVALARVKGNKEVFGEDMTVLLKSFVTNKMKVCRVDDAPTTNTLNREVVPFQRKGTYSAAMKRSIPDSSSDSEILPNCDHLVKLYRKYCVYDGPAMTAETFTLPRLSLAFPYETALIRVQHLNNCQLPGTLNGLDPVLAFPGGLLIIPSSWKKIIIRWEKWFVSFLSYSVGYPFSDSQEQRLSRFCEVMSRNSTDSERMVDLLGVERSPWDT